MCMTSQIVWYNSKRGGIQRKEKACTSVRVCVPMLYGHMLLHYSDMLSCPNLRLKTTRSLSWGGNPTSFQLEILVLNNVVARMPLN